MIPEQEHLNAMIDGQLRPNGVSNHALLARVAALSRLPFSVQGQDAAAIYLDQPLPLGSGRSLLPPRTSARLIQALGVEAQSHVLVIGAGTGYEAALLAPLAGSVVACEDDASLLPTLQKNLKSLANVTVLPNPPERVPASSQPFSHVLFACPLAVVPPALTKALPNGAKLAGVCVAANGIPTALVRTKHGNTWLEETLFESPAGPVHPGLAATEHFVF